MKSWELNVTCTSLCKGSNVGLELEMEEWMLRLRHLFHSHHSICPFLSSPVNPRSNPVALLSTQYPPPGPYHGILIYDRSRVHEGGGFFHPANQRLIAAIVAVANLLAQFLLSSRSQVHPLIRDSFTSSRENQRGALRGEQL